MDIKGTTSRAIKHTGDRVNDRINGWGVCIDVVGGLILFFGGQMLAKNDIYVIGGSTPQALGFIALGIVGAAVIIGLLNTERLWLRIGGAAITAVLVVIAAQQWKSIATAFAKGGWTTFGWFLVGLAVFVIASVIRNRRRPKQSQ